jgi:hypothetical protein
MGATDLIAERTMVQIDAENIDENGQVQERRVCYATHAFSPGK